MDLTECVAKAIFDAGMGMHAPASWEKCNEGQRENVRRQARAAIKAVAAIGEPCGVCGCAVYQGLPTAVPRS
jgi:hypothetical protein